MEWAILPFKKYADFTGRSRRKEYWLFVLLLIVCVLVLGFVENMLGLAGMIGPYGPLTLIFELAILMPSIAVGVRRLHDTDRSGIWILLGFVPLLAAILPLLGMPLAGALMIFSLVSLAAGIVLIILMVLEGTKGPNQYGPDPKGAEGASAGAA